jgi:hypothetical protein
MGIEGARMIQLTDTQQKEITRIADDTIAKFIRELPKNIEDLLNRGILSILGFSNKYGGGIEVDHCNGNRTAISQIVQRQCMSVLEESIKPIAKRAIQELQNDPNIISALAKEAKEIYVRKIGEALSAGASKFAATQAQQVIEGLDTIDLSGVFPNNIELEHPGSYETKVGELILEEVARQTSKSPKGKGPKVVDRMSMGKRVIVIIDEQ